MKNLIIFCPSDERGGVRKILNNLLKVLVKKKINIYLIINKFNKKNLNNNLKIINFRNKKIPFLNNRIISSYQASKVLINLIKKLNNNDTKILSFQSNLFSVLIAKYFRTKIFVRVSEEPCNATKYADNLIFGVIIFFTKFITYNLASLIIVNAFKSKKCVDNLVLKRKTKLLYNPSISFKKIKIKKRKNYFLNVGRLCKQKNQINLVKAFYLFNKKYTNFKLLIIGEGPDKNKLLKLINNLNLKKKVILMGWKNNPKDLYLKSKLFIIPSLYEGMPNSLIEAINFNIPSIGSTASGIEDLLLNGKGGFILKKNNVESIYKSMTYSIQNYKIMLKKSNLAKSKLDRFHIKTAAEKYYNFILKY